MTESHNINLDCLLNGVGLYSAARCEADYEAALVALADTSYEPNKPCEVKDYEELKCMVTFEWSREITSIMRRSSNEDDLAEDGAVGIALMLIVTLTKYTVVERAARGTGVDYLLGERESVSLADRDDFNEHTAYLEVSGILRENRNNSVRKRLYKKMNRKIQTDEGKPVYVIVVEFSTPKVNFSKRRTENEQKRPT